MSHGGMDSIYFFLGGGVGLGDLWRAVSRCGFDSCTDLQHCVSHTSTGRSNSSNVGLRMQNRFPVTNTGVVGFLAT